MNQEELPELQEDTQHGRFLIFVLGDEVYGIEICNVKEIIGLMPVTKLPEAPDYIRGVINLRGKIVPVIDMRLKFRKEAVAYSDRTCIIVVDSNELTAGLIVDNVAEVISIDDENIDPPPDVYSGLQKNRYIYGIGKVGNEVKLLLECENLFREDKALIIEQTK